MKLFKRKGTRSQNYYIRIQHNGIRHQVSLKGAKTVREARRMAAMIESEIITGRFRMASADIPFEKFVREKYLPYSKLHKKSYQADCCYADVLCHYFKGRQLSEIDMAAIELFKIRRKSEVTLRKQVRNDATINRELAQLSSIFSYAVDFGFIESNPCRRVKRFRVSNQRTRVLTDDEESGLLSALTGNMERYKPAVLLALNAGLRRNEIATLLWTDLNFRDDILTIRAEVAKNKRSRTIPMNETVRRALMKLREENPDSKAVFSYNAGTLGQAVRRLCRAMGMTDVSLHTLRHTFATRLARNNVNPFVACDLMGHSNIAMTRHYSHTLTDSMRDAVKGLENSHNDAETAQT